MMTSHDREFMNRIVNKIVEIDGGELTTYSGNYEFYEQQRALADKQQQAQFERQQAMLAKEIKFIERFKARASHAAQVQTRVKKLDKIERVEPPKRRQTVTFDFPPAPRSGEDVVEPEERAQGLRQPHDLRRLRLHGPPRERWCVMGVNGAGKSTLLKLVAGATEPDDGTVTIGASVKMGYFAQHAMDLLDGERTVFEDARVRVPAGRRRARCARSPAASASPATTSRSAAACSRAARRRASCWRRCSSTRRTSWCSTSRPTTSTSRPRRC